MLPCSDLQRLQMFSHRHKWPHELPVSDPLEPAGSGQQRRMMPCMHTIQRSVFSQCTPNARLACKDFGHGVNAATLGCCHAADAGGPECVSEVHMHQSVCNQQNWPCSLQQREELRDALHALKRCQCGCWPSMQRSLLSRLSTYQCCSQ